MRDAAVLVRVQVARTLAERALDLSSGGAGLDLELGVERSVGAWRLMPIPYRWQVRYDDVGEREDTVSTHCTRGLGVRLQPTDILPERRDEVKDFIVVLCPREGDGREGERQEGEERRGKAHVLKGYFKWAVGGERVGDRVPRWREYLA